MSGAPKLNMVQRMFRFTGMERGMFGVFFATFVGFTVGSYVDRSTTESMVIFRDRSALYKDAKKEGDSPSWPSQEAIWL